MRAVMTREHSHDFRQRTERTDCVSRIRFCRRDRARRDLVQPLKCFESPVVSRPPGFFHALRPRLAHTRRQERAPATLRREVAIPFEPVDRPSSMRVQLLPEQKNLPTAQASTRSVLVSFSVMVP